MDWKTDEEAFKALDLNKSSGVLEDLKVEEMISLLSCFVWQEKLKDAPKPRDELQLLFTQLQDTAQRVAKVQFECKARRMMVKLDIYRKFTNALAVAVLVSVGWICYELYFKSTDVYNEHWRNAWIIPAFWQVVSFSLLCVICALWAPSQTSMSYIDYLFLGLC